MQTAKVVWTGGQKFRAISPSGHTIHLDSDRATNEGPGPMELLLMALGACTATDIVIISPSRAAVVRLHVTINGQTFDIMRKGEKAEAPVGLLYFLPSPDFAIVGYDLSTNGWLDPVAFLRSRGADIMPAPFEVAQKQRPRARTAERDRNRQYAPAKDE